MSRLSEAEQAPGAQLGLLISRYTGTSPQFWINLQGQYDLEIIGSALSKKLAAINPVTMISEALKERPKGSRFALAGKRRKSPDGLLR